MTRVIASTCLFQSPGAQRHWWRVLVPQWQAAGLDRQPSLWASSQTYCHPHSTQCTFCRWPWHQRSNQPHGVCVCRTTQWNAKRDALGVLGGSVFSSVFNRPIMTCQRGQKCMVPHGTAQISTNQFNQLMFICTSPFICKTLSGLWQIGSYLQIKIKKKPQQHSIEVLQSIESQPRPPEHRQIITIHPHGRESLRTHKQKQPPGDHPHWVGPQKDDTPPSVKSFHSLQGSTGAEK